MATTTNNLKIIRNLDDGMILAVDVDGELFTPNDPDHPAYSVKVEYCEKDGCMYGIIVHGSVCDNPNCPGDSEEGARISDG